MIRVKNRCPGEKVSESIAPFKDKTEEVASAMQDERAGGDAHGGDEYPEG